MKRRTKRAVAIKRCDCHDPQMCEHPWWTQRLTVRGERRQRINITKMFPSEPVEVAAARAKELARKGLIKNGELVPGEPSDTRLTFGDVADRYVKARGGQKNHYLNGLRQIEVPSANGVTVKLERKPIDEVTTHDIKDHVVETWKKRPRCGPVAIRHLLQTARHLFNWAIREGYATRTPFRREGVTLITVRPSKGRTRRVEEGEEQRILDAADPYITDFFTAMIETGCRPGELRTLQWSEVRGDHFVILGSKAKDRDERKIPIMPTLQKILDRRKLGPDGSELPPSAYVFGNETGEMLLRRRLCGLWLATCERAKVKNLHLHDLRGEAGSQLLEAGVPIHEVRDALGHSSTTMTSTYLRTRVNSLTKAYKQRAAHQARQKMKAVR